MTIRISYTFRCTSSDGVRFGDQLSETPAYWVTKLVRHAHGSGATWGWVARVWLLNAPLVLADIAPLTIRVSYALWSTTSDGVRLWHKTRLTSARKHRALTATVR